MGGLLALLVLLLALLDIIFGLEPHLEHFELWLIAALAVAILIGAGWPSWAHLPRRSPPPQ